MSNGRQVDMIFRAGQVLAHSAPELDPQKLRQAVQHVIDRRGEYLAIAASHGSPLYLFDPAALRQGARSFKTAFENQRRTVNCFFALKSNSYPGVSHILVEEGYGLDVSSGVELDFALKTAASKIIFSGPGKSDDELLLAIRNAERVTVLADSASELERLESLAARHGATLRAGIRMTTEDHGIWRKFGVPLDSLADVFAGSTRRPHVRLCGLQFHISWNLTPDKQRNFIRRLGTVLEELPTNVRHSIEFIDVGGGFWPEVGEWMQYAATPHGMIAAAVEQSTIQPLTHYAQPSTGIEHFAAGINAALQEHLPPDVDFTMYTEPGRWLCHDAMHMLLTVIDRKADDVVITDGGTNAIGWDRYESDYFPVINLSRPALEEKTCLVAGSLCTPHDLWGYSYFGSDIRPGDILLIPSQGAYTYSLRQQFIKPIPEVVWLDEKQAHNSGGAVGHSIRTDTFESRPAIKETPVSWRNDDTPE